MLKTRSEPSNRHNAEIPEGMTDVEITQEIETKVKSKKRRETYSCLCVKANDIFKSNSLLKTCFNSLFATPVYIFSIIILTSCLILITISILTYFCVTVETTNKSYFAKCTLNSDCNSLKGIES